jgi:hypothetical protein
MTSPFFPTRPCLQKRGRCHGYRPASTLCATPGAGKRFIEFFTANIRNPNTRRAYARAAAEFAARCECNGLTELREIEPVHVAD